MPSIKSTIGNNKHISLDDVCSLVSKTYVEDELGQEEAVEVHRQIFCSKLSILRQEFAAAGQLGLRPQMMIVVDSDEYDKEDSLVYENIKYLVYKDFMRTDGYTELYCGVKVGG